MFAALFSSPTGRFLAELPALHQCFLGTFTASGTSQQLVYQTVRTAVACTGILECLCTALCACNVRKCIRQKCVNFASRKIHRVKCIFNTRKKGDPRFHPYLFTIWSFAALMQREGSSTMDLYDCCCCCCCWMGSVVEYRRAV